MSQEARDTKKHNSWQQTKHAKLCSDVVRVFQRETLIAPDSQQWGIHFCNGHFKSHCPVGTCSGHFKSHCQVGTCSGHFTSHREVGVLVPD